jgi:hypothetical protein
VNCFKQIFEVFARLGQFIGVPFGIAISPVKGPFFGLGIKPELSYNGFRSHAGLGEGRAFLIESDTVASKPETQPHFIVEVNR